MILSKDAKSIFNGRNLRGQTLTSRHFETQHINLVNAGENTHAFIVAPVTCYEGHRENSHGQPGGKRYHVYGVYAVDEAGLAQWKKAQTQNLRKAFNASGNKTPLMNGILPVLTTVSEAHKTANALNEAAYESHIKDFQEGLLSGIAAWTPKKRAPIPKPAPQEGLLAG